MKTVIKGLLAGALVFGAQAKADKWTDLSNFAQVGGAGAATALFNYHILEDDKNSDGATARTAGVAGLTILGTHLVLNCPETLKSAQTYVAYAAFAAAAFYGLNYATPKVYTYVMGDDAEAAAVTKGGMKAPVVVKKK